MELDVEQVHRTALRILEEMGIPIGSKKCLELLQSAGGRVNFDAQKVWIPESVVDKALQPQRECHQVHDRSGGRSVPFGGNNLLLTSGACQIRLKEYGGGYRDSNLSDLEKLTRLYDSYDLIDIVHTAVDATELPPEVLRTQMAATVFKNTGKSCWFLASEPRVVEYIHRMAVAIRGSEEDLRAKPFFRIATAPDSVLGFQKEEIESLMRCVELGIPTDCEHYPIMGLTAPLSVSGALAINNANYLCALVVKAAIDPSNPTIFPVLAGVVNMKNAEIVTASPEIWQYYLAGIKMGQHYGIPTSVLISTDAKDTEIQMTYEKAGGHLLSACAGANNIFDAVGALDAMNIASYEDVAIEMEFLSSLAHYLQDFSVRDGEKDFEVIKRSAENKMLFLDDEHTIAHYREFFWNSELFSKENFLSWQNRGAPTVVDRAHGKVNEILSSHHPPALPPDVVREIDAIVEQAAGS
jgi:trimethylamine--corrinoid protein Co-methyltransferase